MSYYDQAQKHYQDALRRGSEDAATDSRLGLLALELAKARGEDGRRLPPLGGEIPPLSKMEWRVEGFVSPDRDEARRKLWPGDTLFARWVIPIVDGDDVHGEWVKTGWSPLRDRFFG